MFPVFRAVEDEGWTPGTGLNRPTKAGVRALASWLYQVLTLRERATGCWLVISRRVEMRLFRELRFVSRLPGTASAHPSQSMSSLHAQLLFFFTASLYAHPGV